MFSNNFPIHIIPNILNEEDIDVVIDEGINNKDFQNINTEMETYDSIQNIKYPQDYDNGGTINLDHWFKWRRNEQSSSTSNV